MQRSVPLTPPPFHLLIQHQCFPPLCILSLFFFKSLLSLLILHPLSQSHNLSPLWYLLSIVWFAFLWNVFIHLDSDHPPIHPHPFILRICSTADIPESSQSKCVWHPHTTPTAVISIALLEQWNVCVCVCVWFYFAPRTSNCLFANCTDSRGGTKDDPFTLGTDRTTLGWLLQDCVWMCVCTSQVKYDYGPTYSH